MNSTTNEESGTTRFFTLQPEQIRLLQPDRAGQPTGESSATIRVRGRLVLRRTMEVPGGAPRLVEFYDLPDVEGVAILAPDAGRESYKAVKDMGGGSALVEPGENRPDTWIVVPRTLLLQANNGLMSDEAGGAVEINKD